MEFKELGDHVSILSNKGSLEGSLAEYVFDKLILGDGDKKDSLYWTCPKSQLTAQGHPACHADRSIALAEKVHISFFLPVLPVLHIKLLVLQIKLLVDT